MSHAPDTLRYFRAMADAFGETKSRLIHRKLWDEVIAGNLAKQPDKAERHRAASQQFRRLGE